MGCEIERGSPEVLFLSENVPEDFTDADNPHQPPRNQDKSARGRKRRTGHLPNQAWKLAERRATRQSAVLTD
jgi:hypothetical protein